MMLILQHNLMFSCEREKSKDEEWQKFSLKKLTMAWFHLTMHSSSLEALVRQIDLYVD